MTQWIKKWKVNNWKVASGGDVKNKEDLIKLDEILKLMESVKWVILLICYSNVLKKICKQVVIMNTIPIIKVCIHRKGVDFNGK